jgi:hypothetical protein
MIEHLTLLLPQQSPLTFPVGLALGALLGGIVGAVITGSIKYAMEQKNNLLQAYSQLIGKKFMITQRYTDLLTLTLFVYSNIGLEKEADKWTVPNKENQIRDLKKDNEYNIKKFEENGGALVKDIENFWKIIGKINSIKRNEKEDELIKDIRLKQISLDKMQKEWIKETTNGLPESKPNGNNLLVSPWQEKKTIELEHSMESFEKSIDKLIEYVKNNKTNKHWFKFLW